MSDTKKDHRSKFCQIKSICRRRSVVLSIHLPYATEKMCKLSWNTSNFIGNVKTKAPNNMTSFIIWQK